MGKFTWENGTLISNAKVRIDGIDYEVEPEQYSGTTPLSANNLNAMQDGIYEDIDQNAEDIQDLKATVLFNNAEGSRNTINLSDSATNYSRIDIEFLMESQYDSTTIYSPNGKKAILATSYLTTGGWFQISNEDVTISGNQITRGSRYYVDISSQGSVTRGISSVATLITKVVGYK